MGGLKVNPVPNLALTALLESSSLSMTRIAELVNGIVAEKTGRASGVDGHALGRMKRGQIGRPAEETVQALAEILSGGDVSALGFCPRGRQGAPGALEQGEDEMRRRDFVVGAAVVGFGTVVAAPSAAAVSPLSPGVGNVATSEIQRALFHPTGRATPPAQLGRKLARAQQLYRDGDYAGLASKLPELLDAAPVADQAAAVQVMVLASEHLLKSGDDDLATFSANQAWSAAATAGDVMSRANASWMMCVVLRHSNRYELACEMTERAAVELQSAGLHTLHDLATYGHLYLTSAYTAAAASSAPGVTAAASQASAAKARAYYGEALDVARRFDREVPHGLWFFGPKQAQTYGISIGNNLKDVGMALDHARGMRLDELPSAERQERALVDAARMYLLKGDLPRAGQAIRTACLVSPGAASRPRILELATAAGLRTLGD